MSNDFDESEKTTVDWNRKLADFMPDAPLEPESICSSHDEGSLTSCDAYAHTGCLLIRAVRLEDKLDKVLAKENPLSDLFALVFDQVKPELFEKVDRAKIMLWCESQGVEVH